MRRTEDLTPTEAYPKILWYQVKKPIPSEEDQQIIYNNHYKRITEILYKKYPTASRSDIDEAAEVQARDMADKEIHKPEALMKAVVNTYAEDIKMKAVIENSDNFIQWYEK